MARIKQTSRRPCLLRSSGGKAHPAIYHMNVITKEFMEMNYDQDCDRKDLIKRNKRVLEIMTVKFRFYAYMERYATCIQKVGNLFMDMMQEYILAMLVTKFDDEDEYYDWVEQLASCMHLACTYMLESMHVQNEDELRYVCRKSTENICELHQFMKSHIHV